MGARPGVSGTRIRQQLQKVRKAIAGGDDPIALLLRDAWEEVSGANEGEIICEVDFSGEDDDIME